MRIRTVKPEFFTDDELFDAEISEKLPLRIAYVGLWCACDREGRFEWRPRQLGAVILPFDAIPFEKVLDALVTRGFVVKYSVENEWFGFIPTFVKHQLINGREMVSTIPDVSKAKEVINSNSTRERRVNDACISRHDPIISDQIRSDLNITDLNNLSEISKTASKLPDATFSDQKKKPVKKKEPVQKNGYNPVSLWLQALGDFKYIRSPKVTSQEARWLSELGNLYPEAEYRAMLRAYGNDHITNGKPWRVFDEFYKLHAEWRSKARVQPDPNSEEALNALITGFEGKPNAILDKMLGSSAGNQSADEPGRGISSGRP